MEVGQAACMSGLRFPALPFQVASWRFEMSSIRMSAWRLGFASPALKRAAECVKDGETLSFWVKNCLSSAHPKQVRIGGRNKNKQDLGLSK